MHTCTLDVQWNVWILVGFTRLPGGFDLVNWNVVMGFSLKTSLQIASLQYECR